MNEINPFAGSLPQSTQIQHQQSADKSRQVRRRQSVSKNVAAPADEFEHTVESAEELEPVHEDGSKDHPQKRRAKTQQHSQDDDLSNEEKPHIDLTA